MLAIRCDQPDRHIRDVLTRVIAAAVIRNTHEDRLTTGFPLAAECTDEQAVAVSDDHRTLWYR